MSSSKAIISEIIPTVSLLKRYLDKNRSQFFGFGTMNDDLKNNLTTHFSEVFTIFILFIYFFFFVVVVKTKKNQ